MWLCNFGNPLPCNRWYYRLLIPLSPSPGCDLCFRCDTSCRRQAPIPRYSPPRLAGPSQSCPIWDGEIIASLSNRRLFGRYRGRGVPRTGVYFVPAERSAFQAVVLRRLGRRSAVPRLPLLCRVAAPAASSSRSPIV